jgi:hypothetical protein
MPHEGGALSLRHRGQEWIFDSSKVLAAEGEPSIGYATFFSDIEHEIAPVISGHRVTLTYNLYLDDDGPVSESANEGAFREAFEALLENPEFLADGGTLAFGLRHVYPIEDSLEHVHSVLKGSDAVVYQSVRALGYEPVLCLYYQDRHVYQDQQFHQGVIIDKMVDFPTDEDEDNDLDSILLREGGIFVSQDATRSEEDHMNRFGTPDHREQVEWVTPVTEFNRQEGAYLHYGNEASLEWAYGDVCLVVRIGKAGERLGYPTVAELKKAQAVNERHSFADQ